MTGWGAWAVVPAFLVHALWGAPGPGAGPPAAGQRPGGYPYASATCEYGVRGGPSCANPDDPGDLYDWGYGRRPFRPSDPWGYEDRNCTSYVAWRLSRAGVPASLFTALGNAGQWLTSVAGEPGVVVDHVASPGAIAVWAAVSGVGHVAWVDSVRGAAVTVADYNYTGTGAYATHLVTSPPTGYIHFPPGGGPRSPPGSGGMPPDPLPAPGPPAYRAGASPLT